MLTANNRQLFYWSKTANKHAGIECILPENNIKVKKKSETQIMNKRIHLTKAAPQLAWCNDAIRQSEPQSTVPIHEEHFLCISDLQNQNILNLIILHPDCLGVYTSCSSKTCSNLWLGKWWMEDNHAQHVPAPCSGKCIQLKEAFVFWWSGVMWSFGQPVLYKFFDCSIAALYISHMCLSHLL